MRRNDLYAIFNWFGANGAQHKRLAPVIIEHAVARFVLNARVESAKALLARHRDSNLHSLALGLGEIEEFFIPLAKQVGFFPFAVIQQLTCVFWVKAKSLF
ncbi:hypothetical protein SDC9_210007 [bioreactor metagenome]|uniref:Uncharacterized protein n=1 Tax=bioreactor metagenome TaxID=1076179 RepID=A0A645JGL8_9ZZZZ